MIKSRSLTRAHTRSCQKRSTHMNELSTVFGFSSSDSSLSIIFQRLARYKSPYYCFWWLDRERYTVTKDSILSEPVFFATTSSEKGACSLVFSIISDHGCPWLSETSHFTSYSHQGHSFMVASLRSITASQWTKQGVIYLFIYLRPPLYDHLFLSLRGGSPSNDEARQSSLYVRALVRRGTRTWTDYLLSLVFLF